MKREKIKVKMLTYPTPGNRAWETIKTFDTPKEADIWLTAYIKENNYIPTDFIIKR